METTIREATEYDMEAVISLIKELATYEKAPNEVEVTAADLIRDGFGEHPWFNVLVAEQESKIVGMAFWFNKYSTWKGKVIYLEDLIVSEAHRQQGIGKMLLDRLIEIGKEMKVSRIDWEVLDWNEPAINFYKKYNAKFDGEWLKGRLADKEITEYNK